MNQSFARLRSLGCIAKDEMAVAALLVAGRPENDVSIIRNAHPAGSGKVEVAAIRPHGEKELRQPEQGFYIAGMKSYGRAPTFLMATGYEQVRSIVAYLTGDTAAAEKVELELPETGVCSSGVSKNGRQPITIGGCC